MNVLEIQFSKSAVKVINSMDKPTKLRIKQGIEGLIQIPPKGDIKLMQGFSDGRCRLRIGKYRVIYKYMQDGTIGILLIIDIGSRGDIYR